MKRFLKAIARRAEAKVYPALLSEDGCLVGLYCHGVFRDAAQIEEGHADPQERATVDGVRQLVDHFRAHGYTFVSPATVAQGQLASGGRHALLTFDDGYASMLNVLPVLAEKDLPVGFFPVTGNVQENRCFWWDVLYRSLRARGRSLEEIYREGATFKGLTAAAIDERLRAELGDEAFAPRGETDRPLTPSELADVARDPRVFVGNHTTDHGILPCYDADGMRAQIAGAQDALEELIGERPKWISYPNGDVDDRVVSVCRDLGFELGLTVDAKFNEVPAALHGDERLRIGRHQPRFFPGVASPGEVVRREGLERLGKDRRRRLLGRET